MKLTRLDLTNLVIIDLLKQMRIVLTMPSFERFSLWKSIYIKINPMTISENRINRNSYLIIGSITSQLLTQTNKIIRLKRILRSKNQSEQI